MWSQAAPVAVLPEQRALLESWQRAAGTPQSVALRCRIILLGAEGVSNNRISKQLGVSGLSHFSGDLASYLTVATV
jgi:hypothetical protein